MEHIDNQDDMAPIELKDRQAKAMQDPDIQNILEVIGWVVGANFSFNINLQALNHQSCFILFFKATTKN